MFYTQVSHINVCGKTASIYLWKKKVITEQVHNEVELLQYLSAGKSTNIALIIFFFHRLPVGTSQEDLTVWWQGPEGVLDLAEMWGPEPAA